MVGKMKPRNNRFDNSTAFKYAELGKMASISVRVNETFRHLSRSDDIFDASLNEEDECQGPINHMITIIEAKEDYFRVLNSWGDKWGVNGTKRIKPCSKNVFWGKSSMHITSDL